MSLENLVLLFLIAFVVTIVVFIILNKKPKENFQQNYAIDHLVKQIENSNIQFTQAVGQFSNVVQSLNQSNTILVSGIHSFENSLLTLSEAMNNMKQSIDSIKKNK